MSAPRHTRVVCGTAARELLTRSFAHSVRAIGPSLGPAGRCVLYEIGANTTGVARGGFEIAKQIASEEGAWSIAPRMMKEAMSEAHRDLGDGTARLACIADAVYSVAAARVTQGIDPGTMARAIQHLSDRLAALLDAQRCPAPEAKAIAWSACADDEVATTLAGLAPYLADEGALDVREGWRSGLELEHHTGFCIDVKSEVIGVGPDERGLRLELDSVHILVVNEILNDFGPLARILEGFISRDKSLVIVARGIEGAARATLLANRSSLRMHILGVIPADVGPRAARILEDVCVATGATLVSEETGLSLAGVRPATLGRATRLIIDGSRCVLIEPGGSAPDVASRRRLLIAEAEAQRHVAFDRELLLRRAARLAGRWAELRIGGRTSWETSQRVEGARAAVAALRAAAENGVVPGGGRALAAVADAAPDALRDELGHLPLATRRAAVDAVVSGCRAVGRQIASNAGVEVAEIEVPRDIVDPFSTTLAILRRALSVAATMLTIEVLVC